MMYRRADHDIKVHDHLKNLDQNRDHSDLELFIDFYKKQGVPEKVIKRVLKYLRGLVNARKFIPARSDDFVKDYGFTKGWNDEYRSSEMFLAGMVCRDIGIVSITEKDWQEFEDVNGRIRNFDLLFKYLDSKLKY